MTTAQIEQQTTALTLPQRAAVALDSAKHRKELAELVKKSASIVTVTNADGREEAHRAGMVLLKTRTTIKAVGKAAREDANAFSKAVIAEEDSLVALIEPEEKRVLALRDAWDEKIAAEKRAKIEAERQRVTAIRDRIESVRALPLHAVGKSVEQISQMIFQLAGEPDYDSYQEFADEFKSVRSDVLDKLAKAETAQHNADIAAEQQRHEAARLIAERAELARLRDEQTARLLEQERQARAEEEERERQAKIERDRLAAELVAQRRAQEAELAEQRAVAARQQAERDAEAAAQARTAKEEQEAAQAALNAERAELQRQRDELEAIKRKAEEDEAERIRLQKVADQALADARNPEPAPTVQGVDLAVPGVDMNTEYVGFLTVETYSRMVAALQNAHGLSIGNHSDFAGVQQQVEQALTAAGEPFEVAIAA